MLFPDSGTFWNIMFVNSYLKYKYDFSENFSISTSIYNRNATVKNNTIYKITDTAQIGYFRPNNLIGVESVLNYFYKDKLTITGGLLFEAEQLSKSFSITYSDSSSVAPPVPPKPEMLKNNLFSIFLESQYKIFSKLSFSGGLRFDLSSVYDRVLTPRLGLIFNHNKLTSKLLYAQAFRAPKPWDYTSGLGNPTLLPEEMESLELSVNYNFTENFTSSISIYKNTLEKAFEKEIYGIGDNYKWINKGQFETEGAQFTIIYIFSKFKISANYTYNFSYNEIREIIPEISRHTANAEISVKIFKSFNFNVWTNYIGKRKNPQLISATNSEFVEPALFFNSSLSFINFHKFDFQIIVKNILNSEYYHTSNTAVERYRQPQITGLLKISYNF